MSKLDGTRLKTTDKKLAVELLERCLESASPVCAEMGHRDGVYSVAVVAVTDECGDEKHS